MVRVAKRDHLYSQLLQLRGVYVSGHVYTWKSGSITRFTHYTSARVHSLPFLSSKNSTHMSMCEDITIRVDHRNKVPVIVVHQMANRLVLVIITQQLQREVYATFGIFRNLSKQANAANLAFFSQWPMDPGPMNESIHLIGGLLGQVYKYLSVSKCWTCQMTGLYSSNDWTLMVQAPICRQIGQIN